MPQWDGWTLAEMSQNPRAVKTWHAKLSKTIPTTADHCARLIRACAPPQTITMKGLRGMKPDEVRGISGAAQKGDAGQCNGLELHLHRSTSSRTLPGGFPV